MPSTEETSDKEGGSGGGIGGGLSALGDIGLESLAQAHGRWRLAERRQLGSDEFTAYLRNGQGIGWQQEALAWRGLGTPIPVSSYLAVSDLEGYVHLLSQVDGEFMARIRPDSDGIRADMLSDGSVLYVFSNSGKLQAYNVAARN